MIGRVVKENTPRTASIFYSHRRRMLHRGHGCPRVCYGAGSQQYLLAAPCLDHGDRLAWFDGLYLHHDRDFCGGEYQASDLSSDLHSDHEIVFDPYHLDNGRHLVGLGNGHVGGNHGRDLGHGSVAEVDHVGCEIDSGACYRDGPDRDPGFCLWAFHDHDPVHARVRVHVRVRGPDYFCHHLYGVFSNYSGFLQELVSVSLSAEPLFNNFSVVRLSGTTFLVRATRATRQKEKLLSAGFSFSFSFILFSFFIFQVRTERLLI